MHPERWRHISAIYQDAAVRSGNDRDVYLQNACVDDAALRGEVEALLAQGESFLGSAVKLPSGTRLGAYELIEIVGAGGMGIVYRARDLKPCASRRSCARRSAQRPPLARRSGTQRGGAVPYRGHLRAQR